MGDRMAPRTTVSELHRGFIIFLVLGTSPWLVGIELEAGVPKMAVPSRSLFQPYPKT